MIRRRDHKVVAEKERVKDTALTLVPLRKYRIDDEPGEKCEWCGSTKSLAAFAKNTYDFKPKEKIVLCRRCEIHARKVGKGAFHFDTRWINAIIALRRKEDE